MQAARRTPALAAVILGFFIVMLDTTIVNVALPDMARDLDTGTTTLQWVVDAYTLVFAALLLSAGAACDRLGARRVYLFGLIAFGAFSIACALAPTGDFLVIARAIQGIGAAAIVPGSLALLAVVYPDPAARARAIGLWGGAGGVAAACGPVLGGALVAAIGWRAVFWVNVPVIVATCWLTLRVTQSSSHDPSRRLDPAGQSLSIAGLVALAYATISAGEHGWSALQGGLLALGLVLFVAFVLVERRQSQPMLPMVLFHQPRFSIASVVGFCLNVSFFGQLFALSLFFQNYLEYSPLVAGLALAPPSLQRRDRVPARRAYGRTHRPVPYDAHRPARGRVWIRQPCACQQYDAVSDHRSPYFRRRVRHGLRHASRDLRCRVSSTACPHWRRRGCSQRRASDRQRFRCGGARSICRRRSVFHRRLPPGRRCRGCRLPRSGGSRYSVAPENQTRWGCHVDIPYGWACEGNRCQHGSGHSFLWNWTRGRVPATSVPVVARLRAAEPRPKFALIATDADSAGQTW